MASVNDLIDQALLFKSQYEYSKALNIFYEAIQILFESLKQVNEQSEVQKTKTLINHLLNQAEQCKNQLNPVKSAPNPIAQLFRQPVIDMQIPQSIPSPPTGKINKQTHNNPIEKAQKTNPSDDPLEAMIENEILDTSQTMKWEDISGLANAKAMLHEAVILPSQYPNIFTGIRAPPKGILLFGPPGTGKTLLAKALASQSSACFFSISASSLTSKFYGEAEKLVRALFTVAKRKQPSVVFIDEVDSILSSRGQGEHEASRRVKTEFLVQMDGVKGAGDDRVILIAATNRPQELDEAVIRRFPKRVYIDLPDEITREDLIKRQLSKVLNNLSESDIQAIVQQTHLYSGSDLAALCKEAAMEPLRKATNEDLRKGIIPEMSFESFRAALTVIRPSVSHSSLEFYTEWNTQFGSK